MKNFAITGVAGFVAPRHLKAIKYTGNSLVAALDPHDSVGTLDEYFPRAQFFTEPELFQRFVDEMNRMAESEEDRLHYISICSPNYLHDAHIHMALRVGADAICEKPLTIDPVNLDSLSDLEAETGHRVFPVLQLRLHPALSALKASFEKGRAEHQADVCLTVITRRGHWYHVSWKGCEAKSGGLATNIGVHLFDLLIWLFGRPHKSVLHLSAKEKMAGALYLERAVVRWFLSTDINDIPESERTSGRYALRSICVDEECVDFSTGLSELHTRAYEEILAGRGLTIDDVRTCLQLVQTVNRGEVSTSQVDRHPFLTR